MTGTDSLEHSANQQLEFFFFFWNFKVTEKTPKDAINIK